MSAVLIVIGTVFALISPVTYVMSIVRGNSKPHRTTRLALAFVQLLSFATIVGAHSSAGTVILAGIFAAQGLVTGALSLRYGMGGSSAFDWVCLCIALAGIVAWKASGSALSGLWLSILADAAAYAPAVIKTWRYPRTETHWFYTTSIIATVCSLAASKFGPSAVFQLYIIAVCLVMIFCIYRKQVFTLITRVNL